MSRSKSQIYGTKIYEIDWNEREGHDTSWTPEYMAAWQEWAVYQRTTGRYVQPVNDLSMFYAQRPDLRANGDPLE